MTCHTTNYGGTNITMYFNFPGLIVSQSWVEATTDDVYLLPVSLVSFEFCSFSCPKVCWPPSHAGPIMAGLQIKRCAEKISPIMGNEILRKKSFEPKPKPVELPPPQPLGTEVVVGVSFLCVCIKLSPSISSSTTAIGKTPGLVTMSPCKSPCRILAPQFVGGHQHPTSKRVHDFTIPKRSL